MVPLSLEDRAEVEAVAEAARKRARVCPICKVGDVVYRGVCQNCGAECIDGVWQVKAKRTEAETKAAPEVKSTPWDPFGGVH